jgi:type IV secretory pathway TrbD component
MRPGPEREVVVLAGVWLAIVCWCAAVWIAVARLLGVL